MSSFKEISIKAGMPTVPQAMQALEYTITQAKRDGTKCLLIVHGYGSSGQGGAICASARRWLKAQETNGRLKKVIFGEDFSIFNFDALELKRKYPELDKLTRVSNHGATVVEV